MKDVNKYGAINYTEFLAATLETKGRIETGRVAEAFDRFDASNSGYITKKVIFMCVCVIFSAKISYNDFPNMLLKKTITPCLSRT